MGAADWFDGPPQLLQKALPEVICCPQPSQKRVLGATATPQDAQNAPETGTPHDVQFILVPPPAGTRHLNQQANSSVFDYLQPYRSRADLGITRVPLDPQALAQFRGGALWYVEGEDGVHRNGELAGFRVE